MRKLLLFTLILILILFPSCTTIPDEPLSPVDSGNEEQNPPSGSDLSSDPRITETQRKEIIDIIEKSSLKYDGSTLDGNVEVEYFYQGAGLGRQEKYSTSFYCGPIEYSQTAFEIFDETFFFPDASGEYIYLIFNFMNGGGNSHIDECISANLEDGVLTLNIKRKLENFGPIEAYDEPVAIFKIKESSLVGNIKQVKYAIDYSALK